ncbi:MAG: cupin domain-containing protein [Thermoleophilia bacterium]|nr:cupin domain-containing protein [Thermoleophilia bacterium]
MSERPAAIPTVLVDNERVRVTEWRFPPGGATGWHRHEYDYVVVPIGDGRLELDDGSAVHVVDLELGQPYFRAAGVEHDVASASEHEFAFVEVELKA